MINVKRVTNVDVESNKIGMHVKLKEIKFNVRYRHFTIRNVECALSMTRSDYRELLYLISNNRIKDIRIPIIMNSCNTSYYIKLDTLCVLYRRSLTEDELVCSLTNVRYEFIKFLKDCCYAELKASIQEALLVARPKKVMGFVKSYDNFTVNGSRYKFKDLSSISTQIIAFVELDYGYLLKFRDRLFVFEKEEGENYKITYELTDYLSAFRMN